VHERNLNPELPPSAGPRALLKARMAQMPAPARAFPKTLPPLWAQVAAVLVVAALATAQRDTSMDWIAVYKQYFQTDWPPEAPR
jgi:hypothetical protein